MASSLLLGSKKEERSFEETEVEGEQGGGGKC